MAFNVGDIVVLADAVFNYDTELQSGDRGTVTTGSYSTAIGPTTIVRWDRRDVATPVLSYRLRLYVAAVAAVAAVPDVVDGIEGTLDTRPLISPLMRAQNPEEWHRLFNLHPRRGPCDVCHEVPVIWAGPVNSEIPTRCTHWLCTDCWSRIARGDKRCPTCRDDLSQWLQQYLSDDDEENTDEDDTDDEDDADEGTNDEL